MVTFSHWIIFNIVLVIALIIDLYVSRQTKEVSMKEAAYRTLFWTGVAAAIGAWIFIEIGSTKLGIEYTTAYVAERALSLDNLFVFIVIFKYFKLPKKYEAKGLLYGILGALIFRALFITIGVAAINTFSWFLLILGGFLIYTAYKLAFAGDHEVDPSNNLAVKAFKKIMPVTKEYHGTKFFTKIKNVRYATPFLMVVIVLETSDIIFAIDSIPTVFGITDDPFIVWSSNTMAILGMRPLYFLLAGMVNIFRYLQYGLALILGFIGLKMIVEYLFHGFHIISELGDVYLSLAIIISIIMGSIIFSFVKPEKTHK